jgi:hypothetical protein
MKKITLSFIFGLFTLLTSAQSNRAVTLSTFEKEIPEFLGIEVDGKRDEVIEKFKAKGFIVDGDISKGNVVPMKGSIGNRDFELNIVSTPKTKVVWKFSVYLPKQSTWNSLLDDYTRYKKTLTDKYGNPEKSFDFFSSPYELGDGYEMTAVAAEKSHYSAYWTLKGYALSIVISKWKQVRIAYENENNSKISEKEQKDIDSNIF